MSLAESLDPTLPPDVKRVCLNLSSFKALLSQASPSSTDCKVSNTVEPDGGIVADSACTIAVGQLDVVSHIHRETSRDGHHIHTRIDQSDARAAPGFPKQAWLDSTMEYLGKCPAPMRSDQSMLYIGPDGKAIDPVQQMKDQLAERKRAEAQFAAGAPAAAIRAANDPKAKVVSLSVERFQACGWIDTGGEDGVAPIFIFASWRKSGEDLDFIGELAPISGRPLPERVYGAFARELTLVECGGKLPSQPTAFTSDGAVYDPLKQLWDNPPAKWAIIPAMGDPGVVGVQRRRWGGVIETPVFATKAEADAWIANKGDAEAAAVNTHGAHLAAASGACIAKAKNDRKCPDWESDYTVLER